MRDRATFILFLIALAMGGLYFLYIQPQMEEKKLMEDFEKKFFRSDTSAIEFLRLDSGHGPITIVKSGDSWKITGPEEYAPDLGAIESLFRTLSRGRLIKMVGDAEDLDKFGFKTVHIILTLGYEGTIDVLKIAGEAPSSRGHYAFSERIGKIFLLDREFVTAMNLKPFDLREKRLYFFEPEELGRIRIQRQKDTVELERRSDGWHMMSPFIMRGSPDDIEAMADTLHTQRVEAFLDWDQDFSSLEQKIVLELFDVSGSPLGRYDVYFRGTEWDKGIVVHRPGSKEAARAGRDFWLLLESNYSKFAYRNLFRADQEKAQKITITSGPEHYLFERKDGLWQSKDLLVNSSNMVKMIDTLNSWKAERIVHEEWINPGRQQLLVEIVETEGTKTVEVTDLNMDYEISGAKMFLSSKEDKGSSKIDYWYARSSNLNRPAVVSSADMRKIMKMASELVHE